MTYGTWCAEPSEDPFREGDISGEGAQTETSNPEDADTETGDQGGNCT